jgi:SNF2 family DNA or RNA helicase
MIELEVAVEMIPYIRTIEGRKFHNGKWQFPDSSLPTLKKYGLVDDTYKVKEKIIKQYDISSFLYGYQKEVVNKALNEDGYGLFLDTGCGKSVCGLEIAKHIGKTLVLCPLSVIETAWVDDCHKFYPDLKIINCHGNSKQERINKLHTDSDVYVMNYESFKILKNEIHNSNFKCMIVDESSVMKNMKAQITNDILSMIDTIPRRYVLSGTPNPNSNLELFPQMKFALPNLFGASFYGWQATYFSQDRTDPHRWYQTTENKDKLFNRLSEGCVFLKKEDCVDLPPKVFEIKKFSLSKQQNKYYSDMIQNIQDNINEWSKFEFTAKLMKLREIVSGFVINKDSSIVDFDTNKDIVLEETLNEIGNKPVIIWCQFQHEIYKLAKRYNGIALTSKEKNRDDIIRQFKEGKIKRLFTHPKLLGKGLTFTNCTYNIYYSLSFSYEEFKQSQERIHRIGQNNKCTYIILQGQNTIDDKIYKCLKRKGNVVDELYMEMGLIRKNS